MKKIISFVILLIDSFTITKSQYSDSYDIKLTSLKWTYSTNRWGEPVYIESFNLTAENNTNYTIIGFDVEIIFHINKKIFKKNIII